MNGILLILPVQLLLTKPDSLTETAVNPLVFLLVSHFLLYCVTFLIYICTLPCCKLKVKQKGKLVAAEALTRTTGAHLLLKL